MIFLCYHEVYIREQIRKIGRKIGKYRAVLIFNREKRNSIRGIFLLPFHETRRNFPRILNNRRWFFYVITMSFRKSCLYLRAEQIRREKNWKISSLIFNRPREKRNSIRGIFLEFWIIDDYFFTLPSRTCFKIDSRNRKRRAISSFRESKTLLLPSPVHGALLSGNVWHADWFAVSVAFYSINFTTA